MLLIGNNFNMTLTAAKSLELIKINCILTIDKTPVFIN